MSKITTLLLLCTTLFAQQKGTFTDTRDGKKYKTVKIGKQVWMAENLNYEAEGSRCYGEGGKVDQYHDTLLPDEIQANCEKYGRLYDWETAMKVCPGGWHLPSKAEWEILVAAVGGKIFGHRTAGKYLKATSGWNDYEGGSGNGKDKYGFSALPGGFCIWAVGNPELFISAGYVSSWWSSTEYTDDDAAYTISVSDDSEYTKYYGYYKREFFSVRCLQNTPPPKGDTK